MVGLYLFNEALLFIRYLLAVELDALFDGDEADLAMDQRFHDLDHLPAVGEACGHLLTILFRSVHFVTRPGSPPFPLEQRILDGEDRSGTIRHEGKGRIGTITYFIVLYGAPLIGLPAKPRHLGS